jgi:hypothetical protein
MFRCLTAMTLALMSASAAARRTVNLIIVSSADADAERTDPGGYAKAIRDREARGTVYEGSIGIRFLNLTRV